MYNKVQTFLRKNLILDSSVPLADVYHSTVQNLSPLPENGIIAGDK